MVPANHSCSIDRTFFSEGLLDCVIHRNYVLKAGSQNRSQILRQCREETFPGSAVETRFDSLQPQRNQFGIADAHRILRVLLAAKRELLPFHLGHIAALQVVENEQLGLFNLVLGTLASRNESRRLYLAIGCARFHHANEPPESLAPRDRP
jgi:hypothetical protein